MKFKNPSDAELFSKHVPAVIRIAQHYQDIRMAFKFLSPACTVKVTRQRKPSAVDRRETFLLSVGAPNYLERRFIKACIKAGELFPVKKVQLKFYPTNK